MKTKVNKPWMQPGICPICANHYNYVGQHMRTAHADLWKGSIVETCAALGIPSPVKIKPRGKNADKMKAAIAVLEKLPKEDSPFAIKAKKRRVSKSRQRAAEVGLVLTPQELEMTPQEVFLKHQQPVAQRRVHFCPACGCNIEAVETAMQIIEENKH